MNQKSVHSQAFFGLLLVIILITFSTGVVNAVPDAIGQIMLTNVRSNGFVVSWVTDSATGGTVTWGTTTPPGTSVTDGVSSTTTHYVTITNLTPSTTYYFQVTSGSETDNNGGAYYQVSTGPAFIPPNLNTVRGFVYQSDGLTPLPNAIVYLQLQNADTFPSLGSSQLVSVRADSSGWWTYNLGNVRTSDFQALFSYTPGGDNLRIIGQGGSQGTIGFDPTPWIIRTPTTNPFRLDVTVGGSPTGVTLSSFTGKSKLSTVQLDWKTDNEVGLVGFNLYCSESLGGEKQKLNAILIPATNTGKMIGAIYEFTEAVSPGKPLFYWLELVQKDGSELNGPVVPKTEYLILLPVIVHQ